MIDDKAPIVEQPLDKNHVANDENITSSATEITSSISFENMSAGQFLTMDDVVTAINESSISTEAALNRVVGAVSNLNNSGSLKSLNESERFIEVVTAANKAQSRHNYKTINAPSSVNNNYNKPSVKNNLQRLKIANLEYIANNETAPLLEGGQLETKINHLFDRHSLKEQNKSDKISNSQVIGNKTSDSQHDNKSKYSSRISDKSDSQNNNNKLDHSEHALAKELIDNNKSLVSLHTEINNRKLDQDKSDSHNAISTSLQQNQKINSPSSSEHYQSTAQDKASQQPLTSNLGKLGLVNIDLNLKQLSIDTLDVKNISFKEVLKSKDKNTSAKYESVNNKTTATDDILDTNKSNSISLSTKSSDYSDVLTTVFKSANNTNEVNSTSAKSVRAETSLSKSLFKDLKSDITKKNTLQSSEQDKSKNYQLDNNVKTSSNKNESSSNSISKNIGNVTVNSSQLDSSSRSIQSEPINDIKEAKGQHNGYQEQLKSEISTAQWRKDYQKIVEKNHKQQSKKSTEIVTALNAIGINNTDSNQVNGSEFYQDSRGRNRHTSGRYASKEENKALKAPKGPKKPKDDVGRSAFGKFKSNNFKQNGSSLISRALLGPVYEAVQDIKKAKSIAQYELGSRGISDLKSGSEYVKGSAKKSFKDVKTGINKGKQGVSNKVDKIKSTGIKAASTTKSAVNRFIPKNPADIAAQSPSTSSKLVSVTNRRYKTDKKITKKNHSDQQTKMSELIESVEGISINVSGGAGGGSLIDDALDVEDMLDKKKRKKKRNNRNRRKPSKFNRIRNLLDFDSEPEPRRRRKDRKNNKKTRNQKQPSRIGKFFGSVPGKTIAATAGTAGLSQAGGAIAKTASVAGSAGSMLGRAMPWVAAAITVKDAYNGFTDKDKQAETFNLTKNQEATFGQKSAMAAGEVLDMGGLVSGASSLIGGGLEWLGLDGAKEAMTFDSSSIARGIYDISGGDELNKKEENTTVTSKPNSKESTDNKLSVNSSANNSKVSNNKNEVNSNNEKQSKSKSKQSTVESSQNFNSRDESINQLLNKPVKDTPQASSPIIKTKSNNFESVSEVHQRKQLSDTKKNNQNIVVASDPEQAKLLKGILKELKNKDYIKSTSIKNTSINRGVNTQQKSNIPQDFSDPILLGMAHDTD